VLSPSSTNFSRAAFGAQAQRLVGEQFVLREAVVQFDHVDIARADAGLLVDLVRGGLGHAVADDLAHVVRLEGAGRSVVIAWARMRTLRSSPCRLAKASEQTMAAAAPQVGGQAIRRVITPGHIIGEAITSSVVTTLRNSASGLLAACRLALARILAKVSIGVPYLLHVLQPGAAEVAQRQRDLGVADQRVGLVVEALEGAGAVGEVAPSAPASSARSPAPARSRPRRWPPPGAPGTARSSRWSSCC
jgi:hypothetical protein